LFRARPQEIFRRVKSEQSSEILGNKYIKKIYAIEQELREKDISVLCERKEKAKPVLDDFKKWLDKLFIKRTLLQKAVNLIMGQIDCVSGERRTHSR
jgi:hypothetical protein